MSNPLLDLVRNQLKDYLVQKVVGELLKEVAFLSWGPLPKIITFLVEKVILQVLEVGVMYSMIAYVRYDVDNDVKDLEDIVTQIHIKMAEKELSDEEIKELDKKLSDAASDLIRFELRPKASERGSLRKKHNRR